MRRRAGSVPERDRELRACLPAGLDSFLEKDGTFTNAERRIQRVRKVMPPKAGWPTGRSRWLIANAMGYPMHYKHPSARSWTRSRADADLRRRVLRQARRARLGPVALQRQGARGHADHAHRRLRARQGQVRHHRIRADRRATGPRFPLLLTTGRILSQYNVGAQTRRTENVAGTRRTCSRSIRTTPRSAASRRRLGRLQSRAGETSLRAQDHRAGAAGRRLHDLPSSETQANVVTTDIPTGRPTVPEYKVTAVQVRLPACVPVRVGA
jgi:formate dehydrogenase major subunit